MKTIIAITVLITSIAITSCKKDAGPKGDKGDKGETGLTGTNGLNGTNGTNGSNGTNGVANITTFTLTSIPSNWFHVGTAGQAGDAFQVNFNIPALTNAIISDGAIIMYLLGSNYLTALPVTVYEYQNISHTYGFGAQPGQIQAFITDSDFNTLAPTVNINFRLVIIPPAIIKVNPDVNWKDYNEVKNKFNLQD